MKANELRIGNLVIVYAHDLRYKTKVIALDYYQLDPKKDSCSVRVKSEDGNTNYGFSLSQVHPIPLTEEWLERFGFDKTSDFEFNIDEFLYLSVEDGNWEEVCMDVYISNSHTVHPIYITCLSYVHQLQNLHFALCGQELKLKE